MPFNSEARRRLQKFVNDARAVIERNFLHQLQSTFGLDPETGSVATLADLAHLNLSDFETASTLRDVLEHYRAQEAKHDEAACLKRILREQTQTFLLRICALRMAEERGAIMKSISGGFNASGFVNFRLVAGSSLGDNFETYEKYLKSLFDEFAGSLPQLFDRTEPFGLLFLEERPFHELLELIAASDLESFWGEDETIGWIFQYFNNDADFSTMRGSKNVNPRNSHELAVRNQFFTPRYVVELLLGNTLGRVWMQETKGQTELRSVCRYLVNCPVEAGDVKKLRDPRTLRMLDPACGSMHFGLYAFDLFEVIYREAWDWLEEHPESELDRQNFPLSDLKKKFASHEAFLAAVPGLILKYNIFGVDIDVRATQIASLALWLRAQKAFAQLGIPAERRPSVGSHNVVAALAPPAEKAVLERIEREVGGSFNLAKMMEHLQLVPETGLLLPLEESLEDFVPNNKDRVQLGLFEELEYKSIWELQCQSLRSVLEDYEHRSGHSFLERLYARNADECLRLVELARQRYDVIVMNPPFGSPADGSRDTLGALYPTTKREIIGMFIERMQQMLTPNGFVGSISSRTIFFLGGAEKWRDAVLFQGASLPVFTDLGPNVMDNAMVESAAYVIGSLPKIATARKQAFTEKTYFLDVTRDTDKEAHIREICEQLESKSSKSLTAFFEKPLEEFEKLPGKVLAYSADERVLKAYSDLPQPGFSAKQGLATGNNARYLRLAQETECAQKRWVPLAKGGDAVPFYGDVPTMVNWEDDGTEVKEDICFKYPYLKGNYSFVVKNIDCYSRPGLTWSHRANALSLRAFPRGGIFDRKGSCVFVKDDDPQELLATSALLNSRAYQNVMSVQLTWATGNSCYECGMLSKAPVPKDTTVLADLAKKNTLARRRLDSVNETSHAFLLPMKLQCALELLDPQAELRTIQDSQAEMDQKVDLLYGFTSRVIPKQEKSRAVTLPTEKEQTNALLSWAVGVAFGRFDYRLALLERSVPEESEPFDPYPKLAPGRLPEGDEPFIANKGIFVMDPGHPLDLTGAVHKVLDDFGLCDEVDVKAWLEKEFFAWHLKEYSAAQRVAPVYWPIGTASGDYVLWLYWPALSGETFYVLLNDFIDPKIKSLTLQVRELQRNESALDRKGREKLRDLSNLSAELAILRDEVERLAKSFHVHFDDGVEINAARLKNIIASRDWVKKRLDPAAEALRKGELDWSETAGELYPERVLALCAQDPSIAIAQKALLAKHLSEQEA